MPELFPTLNKVEDIQKLWDGLSSIYKLLWLPKNMNEKEIDDFTNKVTTWMTLFTSVYHTRHVTPYMHILSVHIPSLLRDTGSLAKFSQQGLEKLNDDLTKDYFKSTNHRNEEALKQIMSKLNRLEELTDGQYFRTKHKHICSNCDTAGHNKRTCPQ